MLNSDKPIDRSAINWLNLKDYPSLHEAALAVDIESFPRYLVNNRTSEAFNYVVENFPETVVVAYDGYNVLATCFSAPIELINDTIPEGGWEGAIGKVLEGGEYNALFVFSISVSPRARNLGLGGKTIEEIKRVATSLGYNKIITPVRPTGIKNYPAMTVDEYSHAVDYRSGLSIDPWLRTLQRHGGELAGVGVDSHVIKMEDGEYPSVKQWEEWTGLRFSKDGEYDIPGGCSKLKIYDGVGEYREDCIWIDIDLK